MTTADSLIKFIWYSFPVVIIVAAVLYAVVKIRKEKNNSIDMAVPRMSGMRCPTDEEAESIKAQVSPRSGRTVMILCLVFLPLIVITAGAALSLYEDKGLPFLMVMGSVSLALVLMLAGMLSVPLSEIRSLNRRLYSVCDCTVTDVSTYWRHHGRGLPSKIRHAVISDGMGSTWETDLTRDHYGVIEGTRCLLVIFDSEEKINRMNTTGRVIYRRALYVKRDEVV